MLADTSLQLKYLNSVNRLNRHSTKYLHRHNTACSNRSCIRLFNRSIPALGVDRVVLLPTRVQSEADVGSTLQVCGIKVTVKWHVTRLPHSDLTVRIHACSLAIKRLSCTTLLMQRLRS